MNSCPLGKSLHKAIKSNDLDRVKVLISNGADVEYRDHFGEVPLGVAANEGDIEIFHALLEAGADPDLGAPLLTACELGHVSIVKLLLKAKADVDLSVGRITPLMSASARGHLEIVKLLVEAGADIEIKNKGNSTALEIAASNIQRDIFYYLYELTSAQNREQAIRSALVAASSSNKADTVNFLAEVGANLNSCIVDNLTPLMLACKGRQKTILLALLNLNVDVNYQNSLGQTALMFASRFKTKEEARMMLLSDGEEILIDLMRSLIDGGADVNIKDREGKTALFYATECGTYKIASFLLEYGINPNLTDIQGKTALEYAKESSILPREIRAKYHDHMIQILSGTSKLI